MTPSKDLVSLMLFKESNCKMRKIVLSQEITKLTIRT